ncbi:sugar ABC transporter substrate-binding protein [Kineosporia mesophila]|uniref:Sugar ABC transporter substrate-binding protein n=1 Tax=Kineosporia mesophila TaxID=566012 RepID=A0ABP6ZGG3_9ACTN|nr:sugar-binding protein [Kineosporia mesophila]MCD5353366.1 sugar-binding protein [Kineosporia mesophila]
MLRKVLAGLATAGLALALTACGSDAVPADSVYANVGAKIGISLPNETSDRWAGDGGAMATQFKAMGYTVDVKYGADDAAKQVKQVQAMVDEDVDLLVITAIDGSSMTDVLAKAAAKNIKIIAYDRLLTKTPNIDYQATFDNTRVGVMQANLIVDKLGLKSADSGPFTIELFAGHSGDANAKSFWNGSMSVLRKYIARGQLVVKSGQNRFAQTAIDLYSSDLAEARMKKILRANYASEDLDAVLSPYDGMTIGIIKALKADGYGTDAKPWPITSGQDSELPSVKSIIDGEQTATIFKDTRELAKVAVQQGNALLTGTDPIVNDTTTYDNGVKKVPTYLLYPVAVDKTNYKTLLVDSGYIKAADLMS